MHTFTPQLLGNCPIILQHYSNTPSLQRASEWRSPHEYVNWPNTSKRVGKCRLWMSLIPLVFNSPPNLIAHPRDAEASPCRWVRFEKHIVSSGCFRAKFGAQKGIITTLDTSLYKTVKSMQCNHWGKSHLCSNQFV